MPNLNEHDLIFFKSSGFGGFKEFLEEKYGFKIFSTEYPPYISFTSKKAILHTNLGSFFLKEKPEYSTNKLSLEKSYRFQDFASSKLSIVPKIRLTEDKKCYVDWKGRLYFLADYKKGRVFNGTINDVKSMLVALRKLQKVGEDFIKNKGVPIGVLKKIESYEVAELTPLIVKFVQSKKESIIYGRIIKCLSGLRDEYINQPKINYIMAHSDFIVFNLVFYDSRVVAINDFDNAKVLPKCHDLAEFLVSATLLNYIGAVTNMKLPVLLEPQKDKFELILQTYKVDFSLSINDFRLLASVAEIVWLWTLCLSVLKGDYKISDLNDAVDCVEKRKLSMLVLKFAEKVFLD